MAFFRRSAATLVLALICATSILGTGLHLLPGCDHFHEHGCLTGEHAASQVDLPHHGDECCSDSDCPICRFLAIPWAITATPAIVDCGQFVEPANITSKSSPAISAARPY